MHYSYSRYALPEAKGQLESLLLSYLDPHHCGLAIWGLQSYISVEALFCLCVGRWNYKQEQKAK